MIVCEFEPHEDGFRCVHCGFTTKRTGLKINCDPNIVRDQPQIEKKPPNLFQRGRNLARASLKHWKTGAKHVTEEQKRDRFLKCQSNECGLYRKKGVNGLCAHDDCGCIIRSNGKFLDKLSWADSECPEGYWGPIIEKDQETPENGV